MGLTGEAGKAWAGARTEGTRWAQNRGWKDRLGTDRLGGRARAISRGLARAGGGGGQGPLQMESHNRRGAVWGAAAGGECEGPSRGLFQSWAASG